MDNILIYFLSEQCLNFNWKADRKNQPPHAFMIENEQTAVLFGYASNEDRFANLSLHEDVLFSYTPHKSTIMQAINLRCVAKMISYQNHMCQVS